MNKNGTNSQSTIVLEFLLYVDFVVDQECHKKGSNFKEYNEQHGKLTPCPKVFKGH